MDIKFDKIKELMQELKYIATDEIVWNVIKGIKKMKNGEQKGQDIYSVCLEGPPGAGKSFYAKTYKKVLERIFDEDVEFLEYQCDSTTGKAELYEEIRVAAAITGNADEVIISGMLVEAIDAVNSGKKVVLLLDEFEKSRRETDSFLYQFLQDGKIKTTQRGDVQTKPEFKKNLQIILCKNDERELADPLLRRNHIIRLNVMTPENLSKTIEMNLAECDEDMKNVVKLLYQKMYEHKDDFAKFPSCSEAMLAIQDACDLLEEDAPAEVIYADILSNLLKHPDDIETFQTIMQEDKQIGGFIQELLNSGEEKSFDVRSEIYQNFFSDEIKAISEMKEKYDRERALYRDRIRELNKRVSELKKEGSKKDETPSPNKDSNMSGSMLEFEANTFLDTETVDVPTDLVNTEGSVFDSSDEWYEIMEIEVGQEGWDKFEEFLREGRFGFLKYLLENTSTYKREGFSVEDFKRGVKDPFGWLKEDYKELINNGEESFLSNFFKNRLYFDGIMLNKGRQTLVTRKEIKDGKKIYRVYSNRRIQCFDIVDIRPKYLGESLGALMDTKMENIGLQGFLEVLMKVKNIKCSINKNYLLFSETGLRKSEETIKKYLYPEFKEEGAFPGVFVIREKGAKSLSLEQNIDRENMGEADTKLTRFYEKLLSQERDKDEKANQLSDGER